jgi:signal transduction histidine kinase
MMDLQVPTAAPVLGDPVQSVASTPVPAAAPVPDFPLTITAMPAGAAQRRTALGAAIAVLLAGAAAAPFAHSPAMGVGAFVLVLQTALCIVDLIAAVLLFLQYSIEPKRGTLVISSGFVCSALFAFAQTLAMPGLYSADALIGDGSNTVAWLFVLWHTTFALTVVIYGLSRQKEPADRHGAGQKPAISILVTIAAVLATIAVMTWLASAGSRFLPDLYISSVHPTHAANYANVGLWLGYSAALVVLLARKQTLLDLWLIVTLFAWWPNFLAAGIFTATRFSIGWYLVHCLAVIASSALLFVLLDQITTLYARIASAVLLLRRDRADRLASVEAATTAVAHELTQPLAGVASAAAAGLNWLEKIPPDIEKATRCFASIISISHRAEETISRIRGVLKSTPKQRTMLQLVDLCREIMRLVEYEALANGISVTLDCPKHVPEILADATRLRLAIVNLVKNAIEAMNDSPPRDRRLQLAIRLEGTSTVALCIEDRGPGIPAQALERLFRPFVTTKSAGMGLGLTTCRAIVEDHGGTLRLRRSDAHGSLFEITLPVGAGSAHR